MTFTQKFGTCTQTACFLLSLFSGFTYAATEYTQNFESSLDGFSTENPEHASKLGLDNAHPIEGNSSLILTLAQWGPAIVKHVPMNKTFSEDTKLRLQFDTSMAGQYTAEGSILTEMIGEFSDGSRIWPSSHHVDTIKVKNGVYTLIRELNIPAGSELKDIKLRMNYSGPEGMLFFVDNLSITSMKSEFAQPENIRNTNFQSPILTLNTGQSRLIESNGVFQTNQTQT